MGLDTVEYTKVAPSTFDMKVFKEEVLAEEKQITDPAFQIGCLEAQISDMQLGVQINPESEAEIQILIDNYKEAINVLKS